MFPVHGSRRDVGAEAAHAMHQVIPIIAHLPKVGFGEDRFSSVLMDQVTSLACDFT